MKPTILFALASLLVFSNVSESFAANPRPGTRQTPPRNQPIKVDPNFRFLEERRILGICNARFRVCIYDMCSDIYEVDHQACLDLCTQQRQDCINSRPTGPAPTSASIM